MSRIARYRRNVDPVTTMLVAGKAAKVTRRAAAGIPWYVWAGGLGVLGFMAYKAYQAIDSVAKDFQNQWNVAKENMNRAWDKVEESVKGFDTMAPVALDIAVSTTKNYAKKVYDIAIDYVVMGPENAFAFIRDASKEMREGGQDKNIILSQCAEVERIYADAITSLLIKSSDMKFVVYFIRDSEDAPAVNVFWSYYDSVAVRRAEDIVSLVKKGSIVVVYDEDRAFIVLLEKTKEKGLVSQADAAWLNTTVNTAKAARERGYPLQNRVMSDNIYELATDFVDKIRTGRIMVEK